MKQTKGSDSVGTLTAREYVGILLKVPDTGNEWIDEMIGKARELDKAEAEPKAAVAKAAKAAKAKPPEPKSS